MLKNEKNWTFNWKTRESIKKTINLLKWRGLSLIGRIQIVKTFAIRNLMLEHRLLGSRERSWFDLLSFIWNGKDKVKRNAILSEVENGGLNMLHTEHMIRTERVLWLQKVLEDYESPWKMFLGESLKPVGGKFLLLVILRFLK